MAKNMGTVTELKKLWQVKLNTKPARKHAPDGAFFLHRIKVSYTVNSTEYEKWTFFVGLQEMVWKIPGNWDTVSIEYRDGDSAKFKIVH